MVALANVSRNLVLVATIALVVALDARFWPILPLGYEGTLALGLLSFTFGVALTLIALVLAIVALARYGRSRSVVRLCFFTSAVLVAFALFASADVLLSYPR